MTEIIEPITKRLQLRQWKESDFPEFAKMSSDPEVMKFFPSTLNRVQSDSIAKTCQSLLVQQGWGVWAVEQRKTSEFVGIVGLHKPTATLPCSPCVEVLWRLARPHWGFGYATEAAGAALKVGFEDIGLNGIVSFAVVDNFASRAVMERIHMINTNVVFEHPDVPYPNSLKKHCLYKLSRDWWMKKALQSPF
ncbi:GNAT family N-acetyltransferase [Pseudoalteromonas luteoviolacea]|uniref:GNAT family N-acetyltransferase n=1 Tax=Pseudoalteromonas luteoviolacea TaxID=43657 RepID=UPI001F429A3A|nr:GNAT family N-acetyltransferase [Pseudoalteromonas luteoviolacea]MCF6441867.1 GNAT family N-acetyltransferase [Pseudoalteromonas luteoviolacea]